MHDKARTSILTGWGVGEEKCPHANIFLCGSCSKQFFCVYPSSCNHFFLIAYNLFQCLQPLQTIYLKLIFQPPPPPPRQKNNDPSPSGAIKFVSVRPFQGNLSLFEISMAPVLFYGKGVTSNFQARNEIGRSSFILVRNLYM